MPERLKAELEEAAQSNRRSLTSEIIARLEASFRPKTPTVTLHLEALPQGQPTQKVTVEQFLYSFSKTLKEHVEAVKAADREERRAEREAAKSDQKLLPPDDLDSPSE
jgi:hypothetical protein